MLSSIFGSELVYGNPTCFSRWSVSFICLYTAVDTDEGVQNCVYPIIYDAGDGAYLYKPYFKTMGTSIIDKNKMAQSTTESDTPVSVRVM